MSDRIEKSVKLDASIERVWRAITDHREFGTWFLVRLDQPFQPGKESTGQMTYPGYEHLPWLARVERMEEPHYFSLRWSPYGDESGKDYSADPWTLVEFRLEPQGTGTRLTVTESGFDSLPAEYRDKARRLNEGGWEEQMGHVKAYVEN